MLGSGWLVQAVAPGSLPESITQVQKVWLRSRNEGQHGGGRDEGTSG